MKPITGSNFYVKELDSSFVERIYNWLGYLELGEFFPKRDTGGVLEVGNALRDIGKYRIYGMGDGRTGKTVVRPGDFVSLLYVLFRNERIRGTVLDSEPGSLAAQVLATGDYKRAVKDFLESKYEDADKQVARVMTEATLVGGKQALNWLKEVGDEVFEEELSLTRVLKNTVIIGRPSKRLKKGTYVTLIDHLDNRISEFEEKYKSLSKSPEDYLVEVHRVPREVAERIVETTHHTTDTVIRATDDTKKNMIGAFKGLASFLHINLDYPLDEAIAKTIEMFKSDEATTVNQTLYHGSKEVFARFEEYGVPREFTVALVDKLISDGSDYARLYAEKFPELLDLSQRFGPNGWNFFGNVLRDRGFAYMMLNQDGISLLNDIYEKDPSSFPALLENLLQIDWSFEKRFSDVTSYDPTEAFQKLPYRLNCETRAKLLTMGIVADSIRSDIGDKLFREIPIGIQSGVPRNIASFLQTKHDQLKNETNEQAVLEQQIQKYFDQIKDTRKILEQRKIKELPKK
jgi:hypothetical protein